MTVDLCAYASVGQRWKCAKYYPCSAEVLNEEKQTKKMSQKFANMRSQPCWDRTGPAHPWMVCSAQQRCSSQPWKRVSFCCPLFYPWHCHRQSGGCSRAERKPTFAERGTPLPLLVIFLPVGQLILLTLINEDLGELSLLKAHTHFN